MWTKNQLNYFSANRDYRTLIVGQCSLVDNGLMYGPCTLDVLSRYKEIDHTNYGDICIEYYHFRDGYFCREIDSEHNVWLPSPERAIVDTITFLDKNYIEGPLIESLQNYLRKNPDLTELRKVADFYKLPQETLNYWIREAEEWDMSMDAPDPSLLTT